MATAISALKFHLYVPDPTAEATKALGATTGTYLCSQGEFMFTFASGAEMRLLSASIRGPKRPDELLASMAAQIPTAKIGKARGLKALTISPGPIARGQVASADGQFVAVQTDPQGEFGLVSVLDGSTWIQVKGNHEIPLDTLVSFVEALK